MEAYREPLKRERPVGFLLEIIYESHRTTVEVILQGGELAEGTERLKTLLEVATGIYSETGESKEVLFNTRAYACLRCLQNKA